MKNYGTVCLCSLMFCLLATVGCSETVAVKGTVKFEDGSPLTCGAIVFDDGSVTGQGKIQSDGSFVMGFGKDGNGVPPGNYKVCIIGAKEVKKAASSTPVGFGEVQKKPNASFASVSPSLVHAKYGSIETTDLTCEVTSAIKDLVFTVEGPAQGK